MIAHALGLLVICAALALSGCTPPGPINPDVPPGPSPVAPPVTVDAGPAATPCERACANAAAHHCDWAGAACIETCERRESAGGHLIWNAPCQAVAQGGTDQDACEGMAACRGHSP